MFSKVKAYLSYRRQAGFALRIAGRQLLSFAQFADRSGYRGSLTVDLASRWAVANRTGLALTAARRIEVLKTFARYCQMFDAKTEIPPPGLFGPGHRRLTPHIYTEQEIGALLATSARLSPPNGLRPATCVTIFGLLSATGLRISEATALRRQDVDLLSGLLHIRQAKFGKSRLVPLHPSTTRALKRYAGRRDRDPYSAATDAFFVFDHGRPALTRKVQYAFGLVRRRLRWRVRGGYRAPRIHDLRHSFVCRRLQCWYEEGVDIDCNLLALSTYIGHAKVTDTYWYITATPELMAIAARRLEPLAPTGGGL
ncbi:MAG: tyrosine-type recombinase/integrase [Acidobacteriia bacterium]|nr:tyrosine-type recombinase/integrase [Terriglobia bacterium]